MPATAQNSDPNGADDLRALAGQVGMTDAMETLLEFRDRHSPASNPRYWAAVNFDLPSATRRLFIFDREMNDCTEYLCAHGKGSDLKHTGTAKKFSNVDGSNCTCLGIFRTGRTYFGDHGYSLRLHGLSATNFNAFDRDIVMHSAKYATPEFVAKNGKAGRSLGCPAVDPAHSKLLIDALRDGSLLIHWSSKWEPDP